MSYILTEMFEGLHSMIDACSPMSRFKPKHVIGLGVTVMVFNATFNKISVITYIAAVSFIRGGKRSTRRKSLTNLIT
jgi:hypothetical protein